MVAITVQEGVRIPGDIVDLESFRRWAHSDEFPEQGRFSFLRGEVWVDLSMEQLFTHNRVRTRCTSVLESLVDVENLGYFFSDGARLSNTVVDLSTEPDGMFAAYDTVRTGKLELIEGFESGFVEVVGTPDMVMEVVSRYSVQKDTVVLRDVYWRAGIQEYWLVDARDEVLRFDILRRGRRGYTVTRRQGGWVRSQVFGRSFQLRSQPDPLGHPRYELHVQP